MTQCYLCAGAVGDDGAAVCGACVRMQEAAELPLGSTAEFKALRDAPRDARPAPPAVPTTGAACTWCGKPEAQVRKLLGNGAVAICNECVALCADVMDAELGAGWRG